MLNGADYEQYRQLVRDIDPHAPDCRQRIGAARQSLEEARCAGRITLHDWRCLLEELSVVQARLVKDDANAWRTPSGIVVDDGADSDHQAH